MHVAIDARLLQSGEPRLQAAAIQLQGWIEAAQSIEAPFTFSLLYDPVQPAPRAVLTSPQWQFLPLELPFSPAGALRTGQRFSPRDEGFVADSAIEAFLLDRAVDLFHATSVLLPSTYVSRRIYRTRWLVTIDDLRFLASDGGELLGPKREHRQEVGQRLGAVVYAQRVQTPSEAAKAALAETAGVPLDKIDVVYRGASGFATGAMPADQALRERTALGLNGHYVLAVAAPLLTDDLRRTVEVYRALCDVCRVELSLVIDCTGAPRKSRHALEAWLNGPDIASRVVMFDGLADPQRLALYHGAALLLHLAQLPGAEGPLLEALQCGAPVVAADVSAIRDVTAGAAVLVDPENREAIVRAVARVAENEDLRAEMRQRGGERAALFTWERTARAVLESYARALESPRYSLERVFPERRACRSRCLHIAIWTPVNPCQSGVSDYSEALVVELGKQADVDVFVDGYQPANLPWFDSMPTFDSKAYPYLAQQTPYDVDLYQVGNNPLHLYMVEAIRARPGIITLHDACIYHLVCAMIPPDERADEFWQEVAYCEGSDVAEFARTERARGRLDPYGMMLNKRLILASRGVVVHSDWVREQVEQYDGGPPVRVIPMGMPVVSEGNGSFERMMRELLGLPPDGFVFGVFGNLHRVKRIGVILRAFARVHEKCATAVLFLKGKVFDPAVAEMLQPWLDSPRLAQSQGIYLRTSYDSAEFLLMSMQAVDAGINLRYPTAGETSGTLSMLLGQSKPVIVSDVGSFAEYPDDCCPKTPLDDSEEDTLYGHMLTLAADEGRYQQASRAARWYSQDRSWSRCAERYLAFIEEVLAGADQKVV